MRHGLQAVGAALMAAVLVMGADWAVSTLSPAARREAGAPVLALQRRAATTTTTSTSSTTTTSTSSTTTTSTSTSTTTTIIPADVSQDANWVTILYAEEATPASTDLADSSAATNPLSSGNCSGVATNTSQFIQGAASVDLPSTTCRFNCLSGDGCTDADFMFGDASDDFTVFAFVRPVAVDTSSRCILGTDAGASGIDTGGWALYVDDTEHFCFDTDSGTTESPTICATSAYSTSTWYSLAVTYDGGDDDAWLEVDGTQVATSASMEQPDATVDGTRHLALGAFNSYCSTRALEGQHDQVAIYAGRITQAWRTRIQVCLIDGSACSCNTSDPTLYVSRPRHTSQGGPIAGPMPACNDLTIDTE